MASDSGRKLSSHLTASPRHQEAWTWPAFYFTINLEWRDTRYNIKPFIDPKWLRKLVFQLCPFIDVELCQQNEGAMVVTTTRHTEVRMRVPRPDRTRSFTRELTHARCRDTHRQDPDSTIRKTSIRELRQIRFN